MLLILPLTSSHSYLFHSVSIFFLPLLLILHRLHHLHLLPHSNENNFQVDGHTHAVRSFAFRKSNTYVSALVHCSTLMQHTSIHKQIQTHAQATTSFAEHTLIDLILLLYFAIHFFLSLSLSISSCSLRLSVRYDSIPSIADDGMSDSVARTSYKLIWEFIPGNRYCKSAIESLYNVLTSHIHVYNKHALSASNTNPNEQHQQ